MSGIGLKTVFSTQQIYNIKYLVWYGQEQWSSKEITTYLNIWHYMQNYTISLGIEQLVSKHSNCISFLGR